MKSCAFSADGRRYLVRDVHVLDKADADLGNDRMMVHLDHRGRVIQAFFLQPDMTGYSEPLRAFYIKDEDTGEFWSAPYEPVQAELDKFEFSIGLGDLQWTVERDGWRVQLRLVVPRDENVELWTATVTNLTRRQRRVSLCSYMPVGKPGLLAQRSYFDAQAGIAVHDYFPYYVHFEDLPRLSQLANTIFCSADVRPAGHELSISAFIGEHGLHNPDGVRHPRLNSPAGKYEIANEPATSVLQFRRQLAPGGSFTVNVAFGPARNVADARRLARKYRQRGAIEKAVAQVYRFLAQHAPQVRIATPDADLNHYVNHWLARRSLLMARTLRYTFAPQGRNVIQDAMGGVYTDPAASREWFRRIWAHQHTNGWLPHGMPCAPGVRQPPINSIPHKDINSWGPGAVAFYLHETGDAALLDELVPFADKPAQKVSLYEHIALGIEWLLRDRTKRGLSRIGQGDWNDPLNQAGHHEKGESIWLSQALVAGLEIWAEVAEQRGDTQRARRFRAEAQRTRQAINRLAWDGQWYRRGFTDTGRPFGTQRDREGKVFINSQSWAVISGTATPARARACLRAVEKHLMTPAGPMTLAPSYKQFVPDIGKLTQKIPGWNENGSVYCHAATFYAYALYVAREADRAFANLRALLPGGPRHSIKAAGQIPIYIPNFYRGRDAGPNMGLSSHSPNTGTVSWYYRTVIAMLLGVRAEKNGLRLDPQLPSHWRHAQVWRRWRGAEFDIRIIRTGRNPEITLDGQPIAGSLIPVQPAGSKHRITVRLSAG